MNQTSTVGQLVQERRRARGFRSQQRLADAVGVDRSHIAKIESGAIVLPQPDLRRRLGEALGLSEVDFLTAAGWLQEHQAEYRVASDPEVYRLQSILRNLSPEDRVLLVEFAELLDRRQQTRREKRTPCVGGAVTKGGEVRY